VFVLSTGANHFTFFYEADASKNVWSWCVFAVSIFTTNTHQWMLTDRHGPYKLGCSCNTIEFNNEKLLANRN